MQLRAFFYRYPCRNTGIDVFPDGAIPGPFPQRGELGVDRKPVDALFLGADLNASVQSHPHFITLFLLDSQLKIFI